MTSRSDLAFGRQALELGLISAGDLAVAQASLAATRSFDGPLCSLEQHLLGNGQLDDAGAARVRAALGHDAHAATTLDCPGPPAGEQLSARSAPSIEPMPVLGSDTRAIERLLQAVGPGRLDRHALGGELARGGMGRILAAHDQDLRRDLVMKQVLPGIASNPRLLHRFLVEAQVTAQLEHPNIVPVHELGRGPDGGLYFTMKRVGGATLKTILKGLVADDPLTVRRYGLVARLNLFLAICNAVAFAHSRGVVHRDLKPDNVMVGEFGEVYVMDWGVAKLLAHHDGPEPDDSGVGQWDGADGPLTFVGQVLGTPHYMSPEQARGEVEQIDPRTDVYALGAILCELLVLRRAVDGTDSQAVVRAAATGDVVLPGATDADPEVPRELVAVVAKAMAPRREARYAGARELTADVEAYLAGRPLVAADYSALALLAMWARRHRTLAAILLLGPLTLLIGLIHRQNELGGLRRRNRTLERRLAALTDPAPAPRAARRLARAGAVLARLAGDPDEEPQVAAAELAGLASPEVVRLLLAWHRHADPRVRRAVVEALGRCGDARTAGARGRTAAQALVAALEAVSLASAPDESGALFEALGDLRQAASFATVYRRAHELDRRDPLGQRARAALARLPLPLPEGTDPGLLHAFLRGQRRLARGDLRGARVDLERARRGLPALAAAHHQRALLALAAQRWEAAVSSLDHALRVDPGLSTALIDRATAHRGAGQAAAALADAREARRRLPGNWRAWRCLMRAAWLADRADEAGQARRRALALAPEFARAELAAERR